ncbi:MAG: ABC-type polysaccharide/polyol phosphate export system, permease component [Candidatus Curtissbacteria bacterium GW2011_GWC2_38_9]|uniref:Transport permease protein n=3 Tax=Candidatus Curtissiibacteriota TaxID=1752717 RepID=A0A1F5HPP1_9BACT|nr:MAG: ABC-type polysaccharide/polyol phosphate export system, permease component [Candidatus Curtissbacteria bacterium GW2011_GWC2_38_9]KKS04453.1 MAG: ABC-type polysaccharide/polyol phosphate export system, permease component [Candidatus Curtissbacteria bacterium GW2011_GWA2_41_24]OGD89689.1 MAG: hypothetical protein A2Z54_01135 [Candidatus Curtissbacteria bacterium RIFCSPHIGHO2_02_39_8]OGE06114.1 MAG: hypothetical protein A2W70_05210 [Candidatus Curtissbacteria bacterium RIFCSPLOWO2_02_41_11
MQLIKNLWQYKELFYFLSLRDLKVRYRQAILGIAWALISPIVLAIVFWFIFGLFLKIHSGPTPYLLLIFTRLTFWNFFSQTVSSSATSVTSNSNLVLKSYFPREILVFSPIVVRLVDLASSFIVLILLMVFYKIGISFNVLWIIPILLLEVLLISAFALIFSSLNVYFKDVSAFLPLLMTAWLFATPIIYSIEKIPQQYQKILFLNPMTGIVEGIKSSLLLKSPPDFLPLSFSLVITIALFLIGYVLFKKLEKNFADVI